MLRVLQLQEIRSSHPPVVTGIWNTLQTNELLKHIALKLISHVILYFLSSGNLSKRFF